MKTTALTISIRSNSHRSTKQLKQPLAIASGTSLHAAVVAQDCLDRYAVRQCASLQDKLAVFDPLLHGGEVIQDQPQGIEFGAVLTDQNGSNF